jgi:hypothetical protein
MRLAFVLGSLLICFSSASAQEMTLDHCSCIDGGVPSDSTFTFRGRLSLWNGNPAFRIWPLGTTRLLGIRGVCLSALELGTWNPYHDHELWADFTVSAVTPQEPGVMQFVCIRSIKAPFLRKKPN